MNDLPARLVVKRGPDIDREYNLPTVEITIGRSSTNVITIADPEVSRRHAAIRFDENRYVIEDWASTNGTFINEQRIEGPVTLYHGDVIRLGETVLLEFLTEDARFQAPPDPYSAAEAATIVEASLPARPFDQAVDPIEQIRERQPDQQMIPEQHTEPRKFRRRALGCGCGFLIIVFLCMATLFFLDAYQQGQILYCGPVRPFFEILLGPFGFSPICP